jgi:integrase/recombinase XerD
MQEATIRALRSFAVLMPVARQTTLSQDLTQTTPGAIDTGIEASFHQPLAPGTIATRLRVGQGFFAFLRDQGDVPQSPIRLPRPHILVPQALPRPMAEDEVSAFFRVIDALRDRTMFLLMRRCGLRVGEVSRLLWSALDLTQGTVRIEHSKGHVDRVVSVSPDVAKALRQWQGLQTAAAPYVFPSRLMRKGIAALTARQIRHRRTRYLTLAGIIKAYSPHSLRQTFATQLLNAGASLEVVKERLGHRSLDVTLRSTQLYDRTKRAQDDQAMAQVEPRQGLQRRETMDDIRQTAIDRFRAYLERRQFSAHTIASDTLDRRLFCREAAGPLAQVSFREVDQLVEWPQQHGRSWATINRRLNALKHFFDFCLDQQRIGGNPVQPSHFVRRGRPLPKALSREQVQRLFAQSDHPLDRALFLVRLRCGLRVSEVAQLQLEQIDWAQQALHLAQGKGRKDRRVYMSPAAVASVHQCLAQHPGARAHGYVCWNRKRHARPLSVKAIQKTMER